MWILHDDANPAPDALAELLAAAEADPEADVLGPKLREWPSLRRLLEVGVTISGTGRRETGLERSEYDQGQHDDVRTVLAVNTAGMLVRRSVLDDLGGFDEQLAVFGNDIDFGWRAAAAGHKTIVVPAAVVFHAEAAHRGVRRTPLTGRHTHYQERRAALYTLLANARGRALPWQVVRLGLGTLLRVLGFLLVRAVGQALDELAALVSLYGSPGQVRAARRERKQRREGSRQARPAWADVRRLLAPWWLPYRHGLDAVSDLVTALTLQAQDVAERRRAAAAEAEQDHPVTPRRPSHDRATADDEEAPEADTGLVARFLTSPVALGVALFVLLVLFGAREAIGPVSGGGLSAAPADARDLWRLHSESWHALGQGTDVPAPPYVLAIAMLATVIGGSVSAAVSAILLLAVPVALWGAWRFLRVVGNLSDAAGAPRWLLAVAATTYALGAGRQWCVGRRPPGDRGRHRRPAVAGARRAGLRRPGARPALARRVAFGTAAGAGRGVHAGRLVVRRRSRCGPGRRRLRHRAGPDARPLGVGTPGRDARVRAGAALAVVAAGRRPGRRRAACSSTPGGCPIPTSASTSCSAEGSPATSGRPPGSASHCW